MESFLDINNVTRIEMLARINMKLNFARFEDMALPAMVWGIEEHLGAINLQSTSSNLSRCLVQVLDTLPAEIDVHYQASIGHKSD